jgi:hypothetical protein
VKSHSRKCLERVPSRQIHSNIPSFCPGNLQIHELIAAQLMPRLAHPIRRCGVMMAMQTKEMKKGIRNADIKFNARWLTDK